MSALVRIDGAVPAADRIDSLRSPHQPFHDAGLTVVGWIRARRMERCPRSLSGPALEPRPVAAIAARWGLSSAADFSRGFRTAHGMPPADYSRAAQATGGCTAAAVAR